MKVPGLLAWALTAAAAPQFEAPAKRQLQGQPIDASGRGAPILGKPVVPREGQDRND